MYAYFFKNCLKFFDKNRDKSFFIDFLRKSDLKITPIYLRHVTFGKAKTRFGKVSFVFSTVTYTIVTSSNRYAEN